MNRSAAAREPLRVIAGIAMLAFSLLDSTPSASTLPDASDRTRQTNLNPASIVFTRF